MFDYMHDGISHLRQTECLLLFFFNLKKPKGKQVNKQYGSKFNIEIKLENFFWIHLY